MLTDEDKARIREEEIFRDEVRKSLDDKKSSRKGFGAVINSPIVIWLLSTVVIGLVSFGYTMCNASRESIARTDKLKTEMKLRLNRAFDDLNLEQNNPTGVTAGSIVTTLLGAPGSNRMNLPEFADRSFYAVFHEWSDKTWNIRQASDASFVVDDLSRLRNLDSSQESKQRLRQTLISLSDILSPELKATEEP